MNRKLLVTCAIATLVAREVVTHESYWAEMPHYHNENPSDTLTVDLTSPSLYGGKAIGFRQTIFSSETDADRIKRILDSFSESGHKI